MEAVVGLFVATSIYAMVQFGWLLFYAMSRTNSRYLGGRRSMTSKIVVSNARA